MRKELVFSTEEFAGRVVTTWPSPLRSRKALLAKVVEDSPRMVKTYLTLAGEPLLQEIVRRGWEGVMAKPLGSPYRVSCELKDRRV